MCENNIMLWGCKCRQRDSNLHLFPLILYSNYGIQIRGDDENFMLLNNKKEPVGADFDVPH
jgi:hypothetical protein